MTRNFWDADYRDNTDLAVIAAGDICERHIDIRDYLKYQNDLDHLTLVRQCLLLGDDISVIEKKTSQSLLHEREAMLRKKFPFYVSGDNSLRSYLLQIIQQPFARWGSGCLCVEHCSVSINESMSITQIANILKKELKFEYYTPSLQCDHRIFTIQNYE